MEENYRCTALIQSNHSPYGVLPLFFSRPDAVPDPGMSKGYGLDAGDSPKHSCNCLGRDTIANAAAKVGPAVVNLSVPQSFHGMTVGKSIGSGTIIDEDGTILTCAHVVVDFQGLRSSSKGKVEVTLQDGRSFEGTVVNADLHSDIAMVRIKSKTPLPTAKLGSSSKLRPGDWVVAMGCPLTLQNTITAGIVSCVDRKSSDLGLGGMQREYLQTDCAINQKDTTTHTSANTCFSAQMYIFVASLSWFAVGLGWDCVGVGLECSSSLLQEISGNIFSLLSGTFSLSWRRVVRPWLGLKMLDLNDMIVAHLKERNASFPDVSNGVLIPMVSPGSPADRAGFRPGDVVVEFGGKPIGSIKEVIDIMGDKIGKPFKAVVKRANNLNREFDGHS
ncbi:UNVERIFIED_CONTAM: putative protease Do-like 14 [Sesamum radiatum]|uniref:Protease Do-like 14 n=1 Tax=Sesamum radiatum TaxID=300843 RepID=A0AAW2PZ75_SESRA